LLAETCRNIGADTSIIKLSSSDSVKNVDSKKSNSCSPLRNGSTISDKSLRSTPNNRSNHNVNCSGGRETGKLSFKPYEDSVSNKYDRNGEDIVVCDTNRKTNGFTSSRSNTPSIVNKSNLVAGDKNNNDTIKGIKSDSYDSNHGGDFSYKSVSSLSSSSSSSSSLSSSSSSASSSSATLVNPSKANTNSSTAITYTSNGLEELAKSHSISHLSGNHCHKPGLNCNACLPSSYPHLSVDSVNKFAPYSSLTSYLTSSVSYANSRLSSTNGNCSSNMCRDPFCAGCRVSSTPSLRSVSCPAGCTQCAHTNLLSSSLSSHLTTLPPSFLPTNAFFPTSAGLQKPNICSWMVGGTYCGKSFSSSEELLQHLRTHTSYTDNASLSALSILGQYPNLDPMLTSPIAGLRRTAFDPVNRYHPYKHFTPHLSSALPSGLSSLASHQASQLNMHYASYEPYGSRIGPPIPP